MTARRPATPKRFFEWHGGSDEDHAALAGWGAATMQDIGLVRASFRGGVHVRLWGRAALLALDLALVGALARTLLGPEAAVARDVGVIFLGAAVLVGLVLLVVLLRARRRRYDVHRGGLALRASANTPAAVVPWASIDPGRIFITPSTTTATGWVIARAQRAVRAPAAVVNGSVLAPGGSHGPGGENGALRHPSVATESPFGWWRIAVADPVAVLVAMESAMVDDGYPAAGLASRALFREATLRAMDGDAAAALDRALADPVIGLPPADDRGPGPGASHS